MNTEQQRNQGTTASVDEVKTQWDQLYIDLKRFVPKGALPQFMATLRTNLKDIRPGVSGCLIHVENGQIDPAHTLVGQGAADSNYA